MVGLSALGNVALCEHLQGVFWDAMGQAYRYRLLAKSDLLLEVRLWPGQTPGWGLYDSHEKQDVSRKAVRMVQ